MRFKAMKEEFGRAVTRVLTAPLNDIVCSWEMAPHANHAFDQTAHCGSYAGLEGNVPV
jgi:hypothetical protein